MNDSRNTTTTNEIIEAEEEANDTNYTLSIAQKCVARVALHLGIETMTSDVLYVLADALLFYMDNVGSCVSHFVERDGYSDNHASYIIEDNPDLDGANVGKRWSGHINIFDLLHGIECCTSQAVNQVAIDSNGMGSSSSEFSSSKQKEGSGSHFYNHWESLAEFLFGKDWESIDVTNVEGLVTRSSDTEKSGTHVRNRDATIGAKGSKSVGKKMINPQHDQSKTLQIAGWNAPFPEEVPNYPIRKHAKTFDSFVTANQACHDIGIGRPLKGGINEKKKVSDTGGLDRDIEHSIGAVPDHVFLDGITSFWGTTDDSMKKQSISSKSKSTQDEHGKDNSSNMDIDDNSTNSSSANPNKRKRTDDDDQNSKRSKLTTSGLNNVNEEVDTKVKATLPSYVPKFLPPFPPPHTYLPPASKISLSSSSYNMSISSSHENRKMNASTNSQRSTKSAVALPSYSELPQQVSNVRSALVSLGQNVRNSYWGEIKNENNVHADVSINSLQVKTSKIENFALGATNVSGVADGTGATTSSSTAGGIVSGQDPSKVKSNVVPVKPMSKASSARASRILEGSMDVTN
jgi:hypothetical protein